MAFYHWMGPAMKATTEGKNEAQKIAEESALKKIQMQQQMEMILNAQQTRRFGEEDQGWKKELQPLEKQKLEALIAGQGLENTGKGLNNKNQELINAFTGATQEGKINAANATSKLQTSQAGVTQGFVDDGSWASSEKEKLLQEALQNQQTRLNMRVAGDSNNRAAAEFRRRQEEESFGSPAKLDAKLTMMIDQANLAGDQPKVEELTKRLTRLRNSQITPQMQALIDQREERGTGTGGNGTNKFDLTDKEVDAIYQKNLEKIQKQNAKVKEGNAGKSFYQKDDPFMSEDQEKQMAADQTRDQIVESRRIANTFRQGTGAPSFDRTTKQQQNAAFVQGGGSPIMDQVLEQERIKAGERASSAPRAPGAPVIPPTMAPPPQQVPAIPGVPPAVMKQVTPQDIQAAQQIVQRAQESGSGSMSGMSQQVPTLAEAVMLIVNLKNQLSGSTPTPTSGAMAAPGMGGRGFGRDTPVAF